MTETPTRKDTFLNGGETTLEIEVALIIDETGGGEAYSLAKRIVDALYELGVLDPPLILCSVCHGALTLEYECPTCEYVYDFDGGDALVAMRGDGVGEAPALDEERARLADETQYQPIEYGP